MMLQGFLLGLSTGATCLAYCSPVLVPYLLGEGKSIRQTAWTLSQFMLGRLLGYILFAVFAWLAGYYVSTLTDRREMLTGIVYILLALLMLWYGMLQPIAPCAGRSWRDNAAHLIQSQPALAPLLMGLFTGLNLCPPFLLAFAAAGENPTLGYSLLFFLSFFGGTALFFVPVPLLGACKNVSRLKIIGRLAAAVMSVYYFYAGMLLLLGGIFAP
ncbi:MAG: sulfite exporter TauE/SafE family protein [Negativicutes bacterium]